MAKKAGRTFIPDSAVEKEAWAELRERYPGATDDQIKGIVAAMPVAEREQLGAKVIGRATAKAMQGATLTNATAVVSPNETKGKDT